MKYASRTMWCTALVALVGLMVAGTVAAQQGQGRRPGGQGGPGGRGGFQFGGFGGFGGGGGGAVGLLQRPEVQEELELLDDQKKQLTELREKMGEKMRDLFAGAQRGDGGGGGQEQVRDAFRKLGEENQAAVDEILLPHQSKRLKQLEMQMAMRGRGVLGGLGGGPLADQLGIDESQQDKLRAKAEELDAELRKKTAEIRKELQDQLLAALTPEQRKQFNELMGEPFEFRDEGGPGFGGGFGGFGGGGPGGQGGPGGRRGERPRNDQ